MAIVPSGIDHVVISIREIRNVLNTFDELMVAQTIAIQGQTTQLTRIANFFDRMIDDEVPIGP